MRMASKRVELWEQVGLGLILSCSSEIIFSNQTGGTSCLHPELEGVFIPLRNDCTEEKCTLVSPENDLWDYFIGPKWEGTGATAGIDREDADFIESVLKKAGLFPNIQIDRNRLTESHEAWIFVIVYGNDSTYPPIFKGFEPYPKEGVLTWQNSD